MGATAGDPASDARLPPQRAPSRSTPRGPCQPGETLKRLRLGPVAPLMASAQLDFQPVSLLEHAGSRPDVPIRAEHGPFRHERLRRRHILRLITTRDASRTHLREKLGALLGIGCERELVDEQVQLLAFHAGVFVFEACHLMSRTLETWSDRLQTANASREGGAQPALSKTSLTDSPASYPSRRLSDDSGADRPRMR
jgi:hypothetical protein